MKSKSTKVAEPKIPSAVVGKVNVGQIFLPMKTTQVWRSDGSTAKLVIRR